ncbi:MAG: prepilin-type N-terminal cleavage/methylation domain-containing protein [Planctomycetota bacterium]
MTTTRALGWCGSRDSLGRPGFSLTELIVVILIIGVVVSIIIPSIGAARDAARTASSQTLMTNLTSAAETFRLDRRRYPGYFSLDAMGARDNGGGGNLPGPIGGMEGLSAAENVMLDLASSDAIFFEDDESRVPVGPADLGIGRVSGQDQDSGTNQLGIAANIYVNPGLIGSGSNSYFVPSGEFFEEQTSNFSTNPNGSGVQQAARSTKGHTGGPGDLQLPDLVDAFGTPLLIWAANTDVFSQLSSEEQFGARRLEPNDNIGPRVFAWNSNAAFLRANELGRGGVNMNLSPFNQERRPASLIGAGGVGELMAGDLEVGAMLSMFLGSPSFPAEEQLRQQTVYYGDVYPARPRGEFIVHSAGRDQVYFSTKDRAVRQYLGDGSYVPSTGLWRPRYGINFAPSDGTNGERWLDEQEKPTSIDFAGSFDDSLVTTN